ncbi:MAG: ATP-binding protein [ANME-2 cluster archaeon]|nr:ATP-binding protein [ANME-2 cluster archaeon]
MNEVEGFDLARSGVTDKQYILGSRDKGSQQGVLRVGRYLAIDGSTGSDVYMDCLGPHAVLICGKRGYGKSYTMGTLVEELARQQPPVSNNIASVIIDSMGIFWTLGFANTKEEQMLSGWNLKPEAQDVQVFVPGNNLEAYRTVGINATPLSIPTSDLSGFDWCTLFGVNPVHPPGILINRTVQQLKKDTVTFSLEDILDHTQNDIHTSTDTKQAVHNYFITAMGWGIFEKKGSGLNDIIRPARTAVIDISSLPDTAIRSMVVGILARRIYQERLPARRQYEINSITGQQVTTMPMVWMFIDEAHLFMPRDGSSLAGDVLVNEWLRQGRQPGLSLVLATQQPSALDPIVLSQSDIIVCHRLTSQEDISALEKVRPTYMRQGIADSIRKMGKGKGVAFIVDDTSEASHVVQMRPRLSWHGGDEPSSLGTNGREKK